MKLDYYVKKTIDVHVISGLHAIPGNIITTKHIYRPALVIFSYFERRYIEEYGIDSLELLKHGTNKIDAICLDNEEIIRLSHYEYVILKNDKRLRSKFVKKYPADVLISALSRFAAFVNSSQEFPNKNQSEFIRFSHIVDLCTTLGHTVELPDLIESSPISIPKIIVDGKSIDIP